MGPQSFHFVCIVLSMAHGRRCIDGTRIKNYIGTGPPHDVTVPREMINSQVWEDGMDMEP